MKEVLKRGLTSFALSSFAGLIVNLIIDIVTACKRNDFCDSIFSVNLKPLWNRNFSSFFKQVFSQLCGSVFVCNRDDIAGLYKV